MHLAPVCTALLFAFSQAPSQAGPAKWGPAPEEELEREGIAVDSSSLASLAKNDIPGCKYKTSEHSRPGTARRSGSRGAAHVYVDRL